MSKPLIIHIGSECMPYMGTGGLGEVLGSLPRALAAGGADARVILPMSRDVLRDHKDKLTFVGHTTVPLAWRQQYCGVFSLETEGVTLYFLDNQYYFNREGLYGFFDEAERFAFFARAALEVLPMLGLRPDVLHCHDWQAALVPVYYKSKYAHRPEWEGIKTLLTIHNIEYQGKFDKSIMGDVMDLSGWETGLVEYDGCANFLKGGIVCCDCLTTVSQTYANELHYDFFAHGLAPIIQANSYKVTGIVNGINTVGYDPENDTSLIAPYSAKSPAGKAENKKALQQLTGLNLDPDVPIIALISRLVSHKGIDLVTCVFEDLMGGPVQFVLLGRGEREFEDYFTFQAAHYRGRMAALIAYNNDLSRKIYSGADIFLMPSKAEPCGLAQMIAMRYGTVPVVRKTGGLADTVQDISEGGNGFVFDDYNAHDMLHALNRAVEHYGDKAAWQKLIAADMKQDFSWNKAAGVYLALYNTLTVQ